MNFPWKYVDILCLGMLHSIYELCIGGAFHSILTDKYLKLSYQPTKALNFKLLFCTSLPFREAPLFSCFIVESVSYLIRTVKSFHVFLIFP